MFSFEKPAAPERIRHTPLVFVTCTGKTTPQDGTKRGTMCLGRVWVAGMTADTHAVHTQ